MHQYQCLSCLATYFDTDAAGIPYVHVCGELPRLSLQARVSRIYARDENPAMDRSGKVTGIRSEGKGLKCLTDGGTAEPQWITALKKGVADREEKENA